MTTTELDELKREVRKLIGEGDIPGALALLKGALPESVAKYDLAFQLFTRYNMASRERIKGVLSYDQAEVVFNRITADFLELLAGLEPRDFQAEGNASRSGQILYKVPKEMSVGIEERCIVRLAFEESIIIQNIELEGAVLKPIRLAEVMEVEMLDPNGDPAFNIRALNSAEQFVEKGDYSEWIFMVEPLRAGELPLMLKVTVLELLDGHERKKEIVLEEVIQVLAEPAPEQAAPPPEEPFRPSGYYFTPSGGTAIIAPIQAEPSRQRGAAYFYISRVAAALALLLVVGAGLWAFGLQDYYAWYQAQKEDTEESYEEYLAQRPQGRYRDQALTRLDRFFWEDILAEPDDSLLLLAYLEEFPQGAYRADAQRLLEEIRREQQGQDTTRIEELPLLIDSLPPIDTVFDLHPTTPKPRPRPKKRAPTQQPTPSPVPPAETKPTKPAEAEKAPVENPPAEKEPEPEEPAGRRSGFDMVPIKGGTFTMGSDKGDRDECPHQVTVQDFKIGRYEITQADWREVMGKSPAYFTACGECPVEQVSWNDVQEFIRRANEMKGTRFRLPTEAEWEYAARAGTDDRFAGGNGIARLGWYHGNAQRAQRVGTKQPNAWGLYDMTGNVWEWCRNLYEPYPGCRGSANNQRALRGGSWRNREADCRTTARKAEKPGFKDYTTGLRLVHP